MKRQNRVAPRPAVAVLAALLAASPAALAASSATSVGSDALTVYNHWGSAAAVSNRFDGNNYSVGVSFFNRSGALIREFDHSDGYQETARAVHYDDDGNLYVAGVRYWQGGRYLWAAKFDADGRMSWEWNDDAAGCEVGDIDVSDQAELWIGAHCSSGGGGYSQGDGGYALRLARINGRGYTSFAQTYNGPSSAKVRSLSVDFGNRATLTAATGDGAGVGVVTIVVDGVGRQIAVY